jgi:hypothetical protein
MLLKDPHRSFTFDAPVPACCDRGRARSSSGELFWPGQLVRFHFITGQLFYALLLRIYPDLPALAERPLRAEVRLVDTRTEQSQRDFGKTFYTWLNHLEVASPEDEREYYRALTHYRIQAGA